MDIQEIKRAYIAGQNVPAKQVAHAIAKDEEMLFSFLSDNNPVIINRTLRQDLGFEFLPMVPDRKKIGAIIHQLIVTNNTKALTVLTQKFEFNKEANNYTTKPELLNELKPHLQQYV